MLLHSPTPTLKYVYKVLTPTYTRFHTHINNRQNEQCTLLYTRCTSGKTRTPGAESVKSLVKTNKVKIVGMHKRCLKHHVWVVILPKMKIKETGTIKICFYSATAKWYVEIKLILGAIQQVKRRYGQKYSRDNEHWRLCRYDLHLNWGLQKYIRASYNVTRNTKSQGNIPYKKVSWTNFPITLDSGRPILYNTGANLKLSNATLRTHAWEWCRSFL